MTSNLLVWFSTLWHSVPCLTPLGHLNSIKWKSRISLFHEKLDDETLRFQIGVDNCDLSYCGH